MNVPTPKNTTARDDAFDRGLERLLQGDAAGIEDIEPELQPIALEMVKLANEAGWIGTEPGEEPIRPRAWWKSSHQVINAVAAVAVMGLIAVMVTVGVRIWNQPEGQYGSQHTETFITEMGPGVCDRAPRTDAEIAAIVRTSEQDVLPFQSDGVVSNGLNESVQLTRDWNTCLLNNDWRRATAYESEYFIWRIGQDEFPMGVEALGDTEIAQGVIKRHALISPLATSDGLNLAIYSADLFRYIEDTNPPLMLGVDAWLVPVDADGDWIEWFTAMSVEWDGSQWVIVSATRDGIPDSPFFRDDTLPESTPEAPPT